MYSIHWDDDNEYERKFKFMPWVAESESISSFIDEHLDPYLDGGWFPYLFSVGEGNRFGGNIEVQSGKAFLRIFDKLFTQM